MGSGRWARVCGWLVGGLVIGLVVACGALGGSRGGGSSQPLSELSLEAGERVRVVATTDIVADVVANVGGDRIQLTTLIPTGTDPHAFEPTPQDGVAVSQAHVVFANGAGLERFLEPLLESAGRPPVVYLSQGIKLLSMQGEAVHADAHEADPHIWTDPRNVITWTHTIETALKTLDPAGADQYAANAQAYVAALEELDEWIRAQVAPIPPDRRQIVTDHRLFAYFARAYGFTQVGAVVPAYSTAAEPSAQELAELEDAIRKLGVKAILVGNTVNPALAQRVAQDTGVQLVFIYTGSLGQAGQADSYIAYMRYNVEAIVAALK